jgi:diguanylate cyclase (GGDEF)-like protein
MSFSHEKAQVLASSMGLEHLSDELTGVFNRRGIIDMANHAYARCLHEHRSFALALIDLDHFKALNEKLGHLLGDAVLREAALRIQSALRGGDIVGRWGGDEFLSCRIWVTNWCRASRVRSIIKAWTSRCRPAWAWLAWGRRTRFSMK